MKYFLAALILAAIQSVSVVHGLFTEGGILGANGLVDNTVQATLSIPGNVVAPSRDRGLRKQRVAQIRAMEEKRAIEEKHLKRNRSAESVDENQQSAYGKDQRDLEDLAPSY